MKRQLSSVSWGCICGKPYNSESLRQIIYEGSDGEVVLGGNSSCMASSDAATDIITFPSSTNFNDGDSIFFFAGDGGTLPSGITDGTRYYAKNVSVDKKALQIAATRSMVGLLNTAATITTIGTSAKFCAASNYGFPDGDLIFGAGNKRTVIAPGYGRSTIVLGTDNNVNHLGVYHTNENFNTVGIIAGFNNTVSGGQGTPYIFGYNNKIQVGSSGGMTYVFGELHLGGGHADIFLGGFHNLSNTVGSSDLAGAENGTAGSGVFMVGMGGPNKQLRGAGVHAYWPGDWFSNHCNKDAARYAGTAIHKTNSYPAGRKEFAAGETRSSEMFFMDYQPVGMLTLSGGAVSLVDNEFTSDYDLIAYIGDDNDQVSVSSTGDLPGGLSQDTVYYIQKTAVNKFKLRTASGGAAVDITSVGTGIFSLTQYLGGVKWLRLFPNKMYDITLKAIFTMNSEYAFFERKIRLIQGAISTAPTVIDLVADRLDSGSNNGLPPLEWAFTLTANISGLHLVATAKNTAGTTKNLTAYCSIDALETNLLT